MKSNPNIFPIFSNCWIFIELLLSMCLKKIQCTSQVTVSLLTKLIFISVCLNFKKNVSIWRVGLTEHRSWEQHIRVQYPLSYGRYSTDLTGRLWEPIRLEYLFSYTRYNTFISVCWSSRFHSLPWLPCPLINTLHGLKRSTVMLYWTSVFDLVWLKFGVCVISRLI